MAILRETISNRESSRGSPSESCYLNAITPNVPAKLLSGPAVKKSWLVEPLFGVPPPNSIPHKPGIVITFPVVVLRVPSDLPVVRLKAFTVPVGVLFVTSSAPLKVQNCWERLPSRMSGCAGAVRSLPEPRTRKG